MLRSLNYVPQSKRIKTMVEAFINVKSPLVQKFWYSWKEFLSSDIGLLEQNLITPRT